MDMQLTDTIADLKTKLSPLVGAMPPNRQKIRGPDGTFLKDTQSLASYNFTDGAELMLIEKERGGTKKK